MTNCDIIINNAIELGCKVIKNEPLKNHTTFKVGGECNALIHINNIENCSTLIRLCNENQVPYIVIGKGSNLIVDDNGYNGIVLLMGNDFSNITVLDDTTIICDAGTSLASACIYAYENGLTGLEFAWGIPGTIGGAVYMNAGAYGGEIADIIVSAEYLDSTGRLLSINKNKMQLSYRYSIFSDNDYVITKAIIKLKKGDKTEVKAKMDELMQRRKDKQPLDFPSAGSTFKRPEGSFASLLIDQCGLKGLSIGGAQVSTKHSGFVINTGNATSRDILSLVEKVKEIVKEKTGYVLECEPKIISNK